MIIDIHAHTSDRKLWGLHTEFANVSVLEELMAQNDVRLVVLLATYFPFKKSGLPNRILLERVAQKNNFRVFGSLDVMNNLENGLRELRELATGELIAGIKLYPGYQDFDATDQSVFGIYELAAEFDLPVMFHTGELHHCCPRAERLAGRFRCGHNRCRIDELGALANPKNIGEVARIFPDVRFIFSHLGNPFFQELRQVMARSLNVYTDISGQFLSGTDEDKPQYRALLKREIEAFLALPGGSGRLMFGTDFPIQSYADSIALVESLEIDAETKERIFWKNAASVLKITNEAESRRFTMKILVTAGATQVPIDQVRAITNIFKGRTGTYIALQLIQLGHDVVLLTSNPGVLESIEKILKVLNEDSLRVRSYRTFDELALAMKEEICHGNYDVVIHSAAVSDYYVSGVFVRDESGELVPVDASKKISSAHEKMYLEMSQTFKIVDRIREPWGFRGKLVKFKLQVGISDDELLRIARKSRADSDADMIVANCLEWSGEYAYVVGRDDVPERVSRGELAAAIARRLQ